MRNPEELRLLVEGYLGDLALTPELHGQAESVRYALVGGKRVRAVICLATAEAAGVEAEAALPAAASLELVECDSEDVSFDCTEAVRRPVFRRLRNATVELGRLGRDGLRRLPRERVHLALVQRRERLTGHVPLIEQKQRRPPCCPPATAHSTSSTDTSIASIVTRHMVVKASATLS